MTEHYWPGPTGPSPEDIAALCKEDMDFGIAVSDVDRLVRDAPGVFTRETLGQAMDEIHDMRLTMGLFQAWRDGDIAVMGLADGGDLQFKVTEQGQRTRSQ